MKDRLLLSLESFVLELRTDPVLAELVPREEDSVVEFELLRAHIASSPLPWYPIERTEWKINRLVGVAEMVKIEYTQFERGRETTYQLAASACDLFERYRIERAPKEFLDLRSDLNVGSRLRKWLGSMKEAAVIASRHGVKTSVDNLLARFFERLEADEFDGNPTPKKIVEDCGVAPGVLGRALNAEQARDELTPGVVLDILADALQLAYQVELPIDFPDDLSGSPAKDIAGRLGSIPPVEYCYVLAALCDSSIPEGQVLRRYGVTAEKALDCIKLAKGQPW